MSEQHWRVTVKELIRDGERLEQIAQKIGIDLNTVECRPHFFPPAFDLVTVDHTKSSLEWFVAEVKKMVAFLGRPPDETDSRHWLGSEDRAPDLVATWKCKDDDGWEYQILVRALMPQGCKIDPRTKFVEVEVPKLHPECAAVLRELEDL